MEEGNLGWVGFYSRTCSGVEVAAKQCEEEMPWVLCWVSESYTFFLSQDWAIRKAEKYFQSQT